jgi:hypothetical protein
MTIILHKGESISVNVLGAAAVHVNVLSMFSVRLLLPSLQAFDHNRYCSVMRLTVWMYDAVNKSLK